MDGFSGRDQFSSEHSVYADVSVLAKKTASIPASWVQVTDDRHDDRGAAGLAADEATDAGSGRGGLF